MSTGVPQSSNPLSNLDQWENFVGGRYKEGQSESEFRQYDDKATPRVAEFYRSNHVKHPLLCAGQREAVLRTSARQEERLGGRGIPEHSGR
jgi:hypothetical protein